MTMMTNKLTRHHFAVILGYFINNLVSKCGGGDIYGGAFITNNMVYVNMKTLEDIIFGCGTGVYRGLRFHFGDQIYPM